MDTEEKSLANTTKTYADGHNIEEAKMQLAGSRSEAIKRRQGLEPTTGLERASGSDSGSGSGSGSIPQA